MCTVPHLVFQHSNSHSNDSSSQKQEQKHHQQATLLIYTSFILGKITSSSKKVLWSFTLFSLGQWWHKSTPVSLWWGRALGMPGKGTLFHQHPPRIPQVLFVSDTYLAQNTWTLQSLPKNSDKQVLEKYPEKQPWFKDNMVPDTCRTVTLMMAGAGLHPCHSCSQEGTRCLTHLPGQG